MLQSSGPRPAEMILPARQNLNWSTFSVMVLFHIGALAALFLFTWKALLITAFLYWITVGFGISLGYHRLHTHRGYRCPLWFEYMLAVFGTLNLEGGPIFWVATHRIHHQKSDQPGDPHSPNDGAFWAHVGWLLFGEVNHNNTRLMSKYAPDLAKHKFYVWLNNYHWVPLIVLGAILWAIGGAPVFFWGIFFRVTVGLHATWLVNSAAHMFGYRNFETRDESRNTWWVALFSFGEGWHNNHHAHPTSARHGLAWYEIDLSWWTLNVLRFFGIVSNLKEAKLPIGLAERKAA